MLVKIKSSIQQDSWYAEIIGLYMHLFDLGNPLYLFGTLDFQLPVFRMDLEVIENVKEKNRKAGD